LNWYENISQAAKIAAGNLYKVIITIMIINNCKESAFPLTLLEGAHGKGLI
jgi:hypothetical protein